MGLLSYAQMPRVCLHEVVHVHHGTGEEGSGYEEAFLIHAGAIAELVDNNTRANCGHNCVRYVIDQGRIESTIRLIDEAIADDADGPEEQTETPLRAGELMMVFKCLAGHLKRLAVAACNHSDSAYAGFLNDVNAECAICLYSILKHSEIYSYSRYLDSMSRAYTHFFAQSVYY